MVEKKRDGEGGDRTILHPCSLGDKSLNIVEKEKKRDKEKEKKNMRTYTGVHILRCFVTGSRIPGAVDPATPSGESWEREPSRGERYT